MLIIAPLFCFNISFPTNFVRTKGAIRFTSNVCFQSSIVLSSNSLSITIPALFTRTSIFPNSLIDFSTNILHSSSFEISAFTGRTFIAYFSSNSFFKLFALSSLLTKLITISYPFCANSLEIASPIPLVPPVTTTTLFIQNPPSNFQLILNFLE